MSYVLLLPRNLYPSDSAPAPDLILLKSKTIKPKKKNQLFYQNPFFDPCASSMNPDSSILYDKSSQRTKKKREWK